MAKEYDHSNVDRRGPNLDWAEIEKKFGLLTEKERLIVELVGQGLSDSKINTRMNYKRATAKIYLVDIRKKLGIVDTPEINMRSILTQLVQRISHQPQLNAFDDSAPDAQWGLKDK